MKKLIVLLAVLLVPALSLADLTRCRVRAHRSTGAILVDARTATGTVLWGAEAGVETFAFANAVDCLIGDKVDDCQLGADGTPEQVSPPPLCIVYLRDDVSTCEARLRNCTPGVRTGTLLTLADIAPGVVAAAFDDDDQAIGNVVDMANSSPTVAITLAGRTFTAEVGADRMYGMKSFTSLYFSGPDCTGTTYVRYSDGVLPVVFIGEDQDIYLPVDGAVPGEIPSASHRGEIGPCFNSAGIDTRVEAAVVGNVLDHFAPPFTVR